MLPAEQGESAGGGAPATPLPARAFVRFTQFDAPLSVDYDSVASHALGKDYWRLTAGFKFYLGDPTEERWVYVPAGYLTDGATVPRLFWSLLPPMGQYGQAAVLHDWLCEHLSVEVHGRPTMITRAEADKAFKEGMVALGVSRWKHNVMYIAVRIHSKLHGRNLPYIDPLKKAFEDAWVRMQTAAQTAKVTATSAAQALA